MSQKKKDFDGWNIVKKTTDNGAIDIKIRAGEIRWCRFGINVGNEVLGKGETFRRPVLILKKFSGDVFLGLPLTTKSHGGDWYHAVAHDGVERTIILNQARVLDRKRLEEKIFEMSETELAVVKRAYCDLILKP
ncbi:MAG: type II toxin-antitoxin system PemK/MazF family toxin [bacterium]|nr:type II toxin-antitoxin system PemK/MazF family toxin [bacterium]